MNRSGHLDNIRSVWDRADTTDLNEGLIAYTRYRVTLDRLATAYDKPLSSVVGMFAALSPSNDYMNNIRSTVSLLRGSNKTSTYNACRDRALRCLAGDDFLSFTKGLKTRSFYQNIMDPHNHYPVTIDGHAYCIWSNKRMTMKEAVRARFDYHQVADGYREVAGELGLVSCQLQAVTWFTWKRIHRVVYNPQMDMFRLGDQWMLDLEPSEIRPF